LPLRGPYFAEVAAFLVSDRSGRPRGHERRQAARLDPHFRPLPR
jgi:hypothetical protein